MKMFKQSTLVSILGLFLVIFLAGCDPDDTGEPDIPPVDGDPLVTLISPASGYTLARIGESTTITFEIYDKELLTNWDATERWVSVSGVEVLAETPISGQEAVIALNNQERTITYTIPASVQVYTTIEIRAYAQDNKGKEASSIFRINVIPDENTGTAWELQEYTDDSLWSITTGDDYNYDIINRMVGSDMEVSAPNRYFRETSVPPAIDYILSSPINGGVDSVLVTTNTSLFNYEECTYETIYQAFVTSNRIGKETDPLGAQDVAILKLPNSPHFAVMLIKSTGSGYMVFDYKYSYQ